MKKDSGKWILLILMICCFGIIIYLTIPRTPTKSSEEALPTTSPLTVSNWIKQSNLRLDNESLFLFKTKDDIIYIGGNGKLDQDDFENLLRYNDILGDEVTHLILGDGITEIGYKVISEMDYLTSLWVGSEVKRISNGAVRDCPRLKYLYLPNSVKRLGPDFLYECEDVLIITNGDEKDLPEIENLSRDRIISYVDSYEELQSTIENTPYLVIQPIRLRTSDSDSITNPLLVRTGVLQYGPYIPLDKGDYHVEYFGNYFDKLDKNTIDVYIEGMKLIPEEIHIEEKGISYSFRLPEDLQNIEFRFTNNTDKTIEIDHIDVYQIKDFDGPDVLKQWWTKDYLKDENILLYPVIETVAPVSVDVK